MNNLKLYLPLPLLLIIIKYCDTRTIKNLKLTCVFLNKSIDKPIEYNIQYKGIQSIKKCIGPLIHWSHYNKILAIQEWIKNFKIIKSQNNQYIYFYSLDKYAYNTNINFQQEKCKNCLLSLLSFNIIFKMEYSDKQTYDVLDAQFIMCLECNI